METNESKVFVGNLPFRLTSEELKELFSKVGEVNDANVVTQSKGFGFVSFANEETARKAIAEMNNKEVQGREIRVREVKEKEAEPEKKE